MIHIITDPYDDDPTDAGYEVNDPKHPNYREFILDRLYSQEPHIVR